MNEIDVLSLDGKLLKIFLTVIEEESVTKAAERLGYSQSSVSHSLDRLRKHIGDPLFVKDGRGITATPLAVSLTPKISEILGSMESLALQADYTPEDDLSSFTIATNVNELMPLLKEVHRALRAKNDRIPLGFIELGPRTNALEYLNTGVADVAITVSIGSYPLDLSVERIYQDQLVCFFDDTHTKPPSSLEEYCSARHGVLDFGGRNKSIVDAILENTGSSRRVHLRASNSFALASLAKGTDALMTLPKRLSSTAFQTINE